MFPGVTSSQSNPCSQIAGPELKTTQPGQRWPVGSSCRNVCLTGWTPQVPSKVSAHTGFPQAFTKQVGQQSMTVSGYRLVV